MEKRQPNRGREPAERIFDLSPPATHAHLMVSRSFKSNYSLEIQFVSCKLAINRGNSAASQVEVEAVPLLPQQAANLTQCVIDYDSPSLGSGCSLSHVKSEGGPIMWRMAALLVGVCLSLPASAATLDEIKGQVLINHGKGFQR